MRVNMVDISEKDVVERIAVAEGKIYLNKKTIEKILKKQIKKGDVLTTAEISAINAVKKTPDLILMCHQIPITNVDVHFEIDEKENSITAWVKVKAIAKTGVEMEALTGVCIALLTIWDMVKYIEKDEKGQYRTTKINDIRVIEKTKKEQ
ncbi:MAG: cyclic pyranopterin monophosphate synthase MoaC [Candidatus Altiarchaeum hamiconexum]|uniref:Cyclic pyranopterin monophosphate synthase MoaC n=1 Tax=Candidatus Altarchaeum hamiconexum TaxID=1803513 RepID=A0A8J8CJT0_9ARCH|nr:cyclic pyranopterin monophosphate synthase MoaC [Candidatus Altarchaeum hamiconexum]OIQ05947.1 MAG: molybdenum cofactor biosynthesis protein C [Candidatus Altarchaeum sp. CG2_30_32_3053]PIN68073.1 MAG: cyclic pyranopterin monophosphate synthase MoaC [Candidatus Altarchaeum sp. CG12_big_fil_rev_8_21_14_0_65_33_22]PIV27542.1 MAG: cyclic pyranopterin monophosphate synthase MoaC [Candidatus Altarchaeum sp. CG03_land_8_20_14_0_80_32_618]PIX49494.1 MAG: cyclic pyranopterin monophosphate synthase M